MRRDLERHRLGQADDPGLGRGVRDRVVLAFLAGDRRDVDDPAPAASSMVGRTARQPWKTPVRSMSMVRLPDCEGHLPGRDGFLADARVVDHDVDPARPGEGRLDHRLDRRVVGDVDGHRERGAPRSDRGDRRGHAPARWPHRRRPPGCRRARIARTSRCPARRPRRSRWLPGCRRASRRSSWCRLRLHFQRTSPPPDDSQCSPPRRAERSRHAHRGCSDRPADRAQHERPVPRADAAAARPSSRS